MMAQMENAENCFKRLLQESTSQKFHKSLERVKKACDTIEDMKGLLNYSRVAQYTENHYGSPKRQSIMNSKRLRLYIDLRKQEYTEKQPGRKTLSDKNTAPQYPCADLDLKTKVYIDQLRARNALLEKSMQQMQKEILQETRRNPIDMNKSILAGAQEDHSMQLVRDTKAQEHDENTKTLLKIVHRFLQLADNPLCPLDIQTHEGKDYLVFETRQFRETVVFADELSLVRHLILKKEIS